MFEQTVYQRQYKDGKYTSKKTFNIISIREMQVKTMMK